MTDKGEKPMSVMPISTAKRDFTRLAREAASKGVEFLAKDMHRADAREVSIVSTSVLDSWLKGLSFSVEWEEDQSGIGGWTVYIPEIDVFGDGDTKEAAVDDLIGAAMEYAELYMAKPAFYWEAGRAAHHPYLRKILRAFTTGGRNKVREILGFPWE